MRALAKAVLKQPGREARMVHEYVESQASPEKVRHAEKVGSEKVFGQRYDSWDVWTNRNRYWVITGPTNLYLQRDFPSLDYTLSFHIGVTTRVAAAQKRPVAPGQKDRRAMAWRQFMQAADALDEAEEAEEFQAVGMRCRQTLLTLVGGLSQKWMVPSDADEPKKADFVHWAELISNAFAEGAAAERIRGYLKAISRSTWELVGWLTHASNATAIDAALVLDATHAVLVGFGAAQLRYEAGHPDRCPICSSYRVTAHYPDPETEDPTLSRICESCDFAYSPAKGC